MFSEHYYYDVKFEIMYLLGLYTQARVSDVLQQLKPAEYFHCKRKNFISFNNVIEHWKQEMKWIELTINQPIGC